jgi:hypothetical protein
MYNKSRVKIAWKIAKLMERRKMLDDEIAFLEGITSGSSLVGLQIACTACGTTKDASDFYVSAIVHGQFQCKACRSAYYQKNKETILPQNRLAARKWAKDNPGRVAELRDNWKRNNREQWREHMRAAKRKQRAQNPEMKHIEQAHQAVQIAIKRGLLHRPDSCSILGCQATSVVAHHQDYDKPLDVQWLCRKHHRMIHIYGNPMVTPKQGG